ncbi:MAG: hypothetical protein WB775_13160, partial [Burkholderiaceae bacterium]
MRLHYTLRVALTLLLALGAAALCVALRTPLPWMIGPLVATAVTEALHTFIGHNQDTPRDETRYLAATAAHITHMLRDTFE